MATDFSVDVLTNDGKAKIAGATAGNRLVYTRVLSGTAAVEAAAAASAVPADFGGPAGAVKSASATGDVARIVGAISSESGPATLKTFALCGKLESDEDDVVLAVKSDPDVAVPLPGPTAPTTVIEIDFNLKIASASSVNVQIIGTGSAALADLDRFVSLHKAGDTEAGEAQVVLGNKYFRGRVGARTLWLMPDGASAAIATAQAEWDADEYRSTVTISTRTQTGIQPAVYINGSRGDATWVSVVGDAEVGGYLTVGGTFEVTGTATFNGTLTINDPLVATEYISVDGAIYIKDTTNTAKSGEIAFFGDADDEYTSLRFYVEGVNDTDALELTRDLSDDSLLAEVWGALKAHGDISTTGAVRAGTLSGVLSSLYGDGAGALVVLSIAGTTSAGVSDSVSLARAASVYAGKTETGTGGATITLGVTADGYTASATTRFRLLQAVSISTPAMGGTGSAVTSLAVVETA